MTHRARIEAAIAGETVDRIPAIFRMDKWYQARLRANDLPGELAGMSLQDVEAHLGLARSAREAIVFKTVLHSPVERIESRKGELLITEWHTLARTLRQVRRYGPGDEGAGLEPTIIEFPIKSWQDYSAYAEIHRHMEFVPAYEDYLRYDRMIGDAGLPMVIVGGIPFHEFLLRWAGYEKGYLDLHDRPDIVLEAVEEANTAYRKMWQIVAESPARLILHGVNFSTHMTSPPVFRERFLPYLTPFNRQMHQAGKWVAFHADGDLTGLLELTLEAGFDVADCFACDPLVRCTVAQAREAWQDRMTIWGGLPSILLEPHVPLDQLRGYLERLYRDIAPGDHFMLAITDMAMPTASWDHLALVGQWVRERSSYPIDLPAPCRA